MRFKRLIAKLDIKNDILVKGIQLEGLRAFGKPYEFSENYYDQGIDEIIYIDVVASLYGQNSLKKILRETAKNVFIPITAGGGIKTLKDAYELLNNGADKISVNTAAVKNPKFLELLVKEFGSSTISVSIDTLQFKDLKYYIFTDYGRENSGKELFQWIKEVENIGAGEILLTDIKKEGTAVGPSIDLFKNVNKKISIPLIAHGGIGSSNHILDLFLNTDVDGVSASSIFHYNLIKNKKIKMHKINGNTTFVDSGKNKKFIEDTNIKMIKKKISENKIAIRI